jgi:F0F1-type ATP synthase assembly protein I
VELRDRRETYRGFGDALARAIELVVTPLLFGLGGHFLDRWLGTSPLLLIVFVAFAVVGLAVRTYYAYETEMRAHEARLLGPARREPSA